MPRFKKIVLGIALGSVLSFTFSVIYCPTPQAPLVSTLLVLGKKDHQLWAVKRLAKMGEPGLGGLGLALESEESEVRTMAINAVYEKGPAARPLAAMLATLLYDDDRYIDCAASACLANIGEGAAPFQTKLRRELDREFGREHSFCGGVVKKLAKLEEFRGPVRTCAKGDQCCHKVRAIAELGPTASESIPTLTRVLKHSKNERLVSHAAYALAQLGPSAASASPTIKRRLKRFNLKAEFVKRLRRLRKSHQIEPDFECPEVFLIYALWKIEGPENIPWDILARLKENSGGHGDYDLLWLMKELEDVVPVRSDEAQLLKPLDKS